jgi:hypothetical protein
MLLGVTVHGTREAHSAILGRDSNLRSIDAWFEFQFLQNIPLKFRVAFRHK